MDWREGFDGSLLDKEALQFLIDFHLHGPAKGITAQVMEKGLGSLNQKQAYVFKTYVVDQWLNNTCHICGQVEGHELIGLWENEGYCGRCSYRMENEARRENSSNV